MLDATRRTKDKAAEAHACQIICSIQLDRDNPIEALKLANEAQSLSKKAGDKCMECNAQILVSTSMCAAFSQSGKSMDKARAKAMRPAQEALMMAKKLNHRVLMAHALQQVATVHSMTGRLGEALQSANEARSIFHAEGDMVNEAHAVMLIAKVQQAAGKEDRAIERLEEVKVLADATGDEKLSQHAQQLMDKIRPPIPGMGSGHWVMQAPASSSTQPAQVEAAVLQSQSVVEAAPSKALDEDTVKKVVMAVLAELIGSTHDELTLDNDDALMESGLDSLSALSFRQVLQQHLGTRLPASFVFDYPTVKAVTERIVQMSLEDG
jgi:acyl carrier protein